MWLTSCCLPYTPFFSTFLSVPSLFSASLSLYLSLSLSLSLSHSSSLSLPLSITLLISTTIDFHFIVSAPAYLICSFCPFLFALAAAPLFISYYSYNRRYCSDDHLPYCHDIGSYGWHAVRAPSHAHSHGCPTRWKCVHRRYVRSLYMWSPRSS